MKLIVRKLNTHKLPGGSRAIVWNHLASNSNRLNCWSIFRESHSH